MKRSIQHPASWGTLLAGASIALVALACSPDSPAYPEAPADLPRVEKLTHKGYTEKIPDSDTAMLSTMCGHGMISHSLAKKMICFVKENRRTSEQAASVLSRFCSCGIFNPSRAKRILENARIGHPV